MHFRRPCLSNISPLHLVRARALRLTCRVCLSVSCRPGRWGSSYQYAQTSCASKSCSYGCYTWDSGLDSGCCRPHRRPPASCFQWSSRPHSTFSQHSLHSCQQPFAPILSLISMWNWLSWRRWLVRWASEPLLSQVIIKMLTSFLDFWFFVG